MTAPTPSARQPEVADVATSGCGHWTMIERTADFLALVQRFLAG